MKTVVLTTILSLGLSVSVTADEQREPTRIALIDMAHVFKNYEKFDALREELQGEIAEADAESRRMAIPGQRLQNRLTGLEEGSDEFVETQQALTVEKRIVEDFRKQMQRDFLKRESEIYRTVYLEVSDQVERHAKENGYNLVIRFSREPLSEAGTPADVIKRMNTLVVFTAEENDITDTVLESLNERYKEVAASN